MEDIQQNIANWLQSLKGWQKELAYRLFNKKQLEYQDIEDVESMLKEDVQFEEKEFPSFGISVSGHNITLSSIQGIENIEQLAPHTPLLFQEAGLTIVYGLNGSGKSGYTRILKKICGKLHCRNLIDNIYKPSGNIGKCSISYKIDGQEKTQSWLVTDGAIEDLKAIDIFDSETGWAYISSENEVSYTPPIMSFFSQFANYHNTIKDKLSQEVQQLRTKLPPSPAEFNDTTFIRDAYLGTKLDASKFVWNEDDERKLAELEKELRERDFHKVVIELTKKKETLDSLIQQITEFAEKVSAQSQTEIIEFKKDLDSKELALSDAGKALHDISELDGIGTDSWKQLWLAAKEYATNVAYKNDNALYEQELCVLCHQPLGDDAKERLKRFDSFIDDKLSRDVDLARKKYENKINALPACPDKTYVDTICLASGLEEDWTAPIFNVFSQICLNAENIKAGKQIIEQSDEICSTLEGLRNISGGYESEINKNKEYSQSFNREEKRKRSLELRARKWCCEQINAIKEEISVRQQKEVYEKWISQINTRGISDKAKEIGDAIITNAFVDRFNNELQRLGANGIKVRINKRSQQGVILHKLRLSSETDDNPIDILSEGETRIIELAAFLADVTGGNNNNPFIFDDPISSLDQAYEEQTINRLVELSQARQVIVFTHRLSLLSQLRERCDDSMSCQIRKEEWGTGEISKLHLAAKNPKSALNNLLNEDLSKAKKKYKENGYEDYYSHAKMICSEFRILIERVVEKCLLCGIVERYRLAINTKGKLNKLASVNMDDCNMIDGLMTKYSFSEHSQPQESPRELPMPDEIGEDINSLLSWITEFEKR